MTTANKATLKALFQTGDVPVGQNYSDWIDSDVNLVETATQVMAGALSSPELMGALVSAGNINSTGTLTYNLLQYGTVSAAGSTQATGAALSYVLNFGAGVTDGQTTGFLLPANLKGRVQYIVNGGASANLWPCVGGQINALSSNAAFAMAANTPYMIIHTAASGYVVK